MKSTGSLSVLVLFLLINPVYSLVSDIQSEYVLYPVLMYGTRRISSSERLQCPSLSDALSKVKRFNIRLATAEPRTRVGYICTGVSSSIKCSSSILQYQTSSSNGLIQVNKSECEVAVSKFSHGHVSGFKETTPDCALGYSSEKHVHQLIVRRQILPFSPVKNGVVSNMFHDSVCLTRYCLSQDGKSHWFLEESESPGCSGLVDGYGELKLSAAGRGGHQLISTSVRGDVPLREICKTEDYCGLATYVDYSFNGFSVPSLSGDIGSILTSSVGNCQSQGIIREYNGNELTTMTSLTEIIQRRHYQCQEVLSKGRREGFISSRYLTLFQPYQEGIAPGYRLEDGKLWEYDLYYITGLFKAQPIERSDYKTYKWDVIDVAGTATPLLPSLCSFNLSFENSAEGSLCYWFNGIQIQGPHVFYPDIVNHFEYSRDYPMIPYQSDFDARDGNETTSIWVEGLVVKTIPLWGELMIGCGALLITLISIRKLYLHFMGSPSSKFSPGPESISPGVEITELGSVQPSLTCPRPVPALGWVPTRPIESDNNIHMLEWFDP